MALYKVKGSKYQSGGHWVTVKEGRWKGQHVFIKDGQTFDDAISERAKHSKGLENRPVADKLAKQKANKSEFYNKLNNEDKKKYDDYIAKGYSKSDIENTLMYKTKEQEMKDAGIKFVQSNKLELSEKQIEEGNRLTNKAENGVRDDIKAFLSGKENYDGSQEQFINDLSDNWGVDKERVEDILHEESSKHPRLFKEVRQGIELNYDPTPLKTEKAPEDKGYFTFEKDENGEYKEKWNEPSSKMTKYDYEAVDYMKQKGRNQEAENYIKMVEQNKDDTFTKAKSSGEWYDTNKNDNTLSKLENDTKDLTDYDKYNLAIEKLERKDQLSSDEKHFWNRAKMEYERKQKSLEETDALKLQRPVIRNGKKAYVHNYLGDDERGYWTIENGSRVFKENPRYISDEQDKANREFTGNTKVNLGKIDYYGNGRKSNNATIEMELKNGVFSAHGNIWNSKGTDIVRGGQMIDALEPYFKDNKDYQTIKTMWEKYHLNDMHAGTERQEKILEQFKGERASIATKMNEGKTYDWQKVSENDYDVTKKLLENHGALVDNGYQYGTSWLKRDIPKEDLNTIRGLIDKYNNLPDEPIKKTTRVSSKPKVTKSIEPKVVDDNIASVKLEPRYDSRKSFYGKAKTNASNTKLWSYDTLVAEIKNGEINVYNTQSQTTKRHIRDWLQQKGYGLEEANQTMRLSQLVQSYVDRGYSEETARKMAKQAINKRKRK